jgi:hypothetical protein
MGMYTDISPINYLFLRAAELPDGNHNPYNFTINSFKTGNNGQAG